MEANRVPLPLVRSPTSDSGSLWESVCTDQLSFSSRESTMNLGLVFALGAVLANSQADQQIQTHFQSSVRGATSDEWFEFLHANKELGNGVYSLPIMGVAWVLGESIDGPFAIELTGEWGERSIRGFLVGAIPLVVLQRMTGGSRPFETGENSEWHPMRDNNGVSGHAFMSSLPFITVAKLTDNRWQKSLWYSASMIGPLSRLNDNAHYTSQVGMGWALAFLSATAVDQSESHDAHRWSFRPHSPAGGSGLAMEYQW